MPGLKPGYRVSTLRTPVGVGVPRLGPMNVHVSLLWLEQGDQELCGIMVGFGVDQAHIYRRRRIYIYVCVDRCSALAFRPGEKEDLLAKLQEAVGARGGV